MRFTEDFSDERNKAWCIHCRATVSRVPANMDHVPSKCLLSRSMRERGARWDAGEGDDDGYLPQVLVCKECNAGFSTDENYLLCVLHAVMAGNLYPDKQTHPEAAAVLRSNRHVVKALKAMPDGQLMLFPNLEPFTLYPEMTRIERVVVKNARGHAYHEIAESPAGSPASVSILPLSSMTAEARSQFEARNSANDLWPEVGSRMMVHLIDGQVLVGEWIEVEPQRYRYALDWSDGVTVRSVIWNYLATEVHWER